MGQIDFVTTKEACEMCRCSRATLERARKQGILHVVRPNALMKPGKNTTVLYRLEELNAWLNGTLGKGVK